MHDCEGSLTLLLSTPRPDGGEQPLPCPYCGQYIRSEVRDGVRVYSPHFGQVSW